MKTSHLGLSVSKFLTLCTLSNQVSFLMLFALAEKQYLVFPQDHDVSRLRFLATQAGSAWVSSCGLGLKSNENMVGLSYIYATITPAYYLTGGYHCRLQDLQLGWWLSFSSGSSITSSTMSPTVGVRDLGGEQFDLSVFSEICKCYLQPKGLTIHQCVGKEVA